MKAILSKEGGGYDLYRIDKDGKRITFASTQDYKQKLSLKNCQDIERGYDLDELAEKACPDVISSAHSAFKAGFQKALEILGDKKFNEEDMKSFARNYYREIRENTSNLLWTQLADKCIEEHIQSLQQTEWAVTFNPEELDADGCLILKLKLE